MTNEKIFLQQGGVTVTSTQSKSGCEIRSKIKRI